MFQRIEQSAGRDLSAAEAKSSVRDRIVASAVETRSDIDPSLAVSISVGARDERPARESLRAQIAKLEREHSRLLTARFPFAPARERESLLATPTGPHLVDLGELERTRDRLACRLQDLRAEAAVRTERERDAEELLERMRADPARHRYDRVPVRDLGQGGCGVWEVRPRLGIVGMLAGWWELTLSSGCP